MLHTVLLILVFFFVKQKTAYERRMSDWSSDVCSSDLRPRSAHPGRGASRTHRQADCSDCRTLAFKSLLTGRNAKDAGERNLANQRLSVDRVRSEEHTSELQSLMRISYAVFCLKKKNKKKNSSRQKPTHRQIRPIKSNIL